MGLGHPDILRRRSRKLAKDRPFAVDVYDTYMCARPEAKRQASASPLAANPIALPHRARAPSGGRALGSGLAALPQSISDVL
jgi:hypothetical protein